MTRRGLGNLVGIFAALGLAMAAVGSARSEAAPETAVSTRGASGLRFTTLKGGERGLIDTAGEAVPLRDYRRIVSGSTLVDHVLFEICERDRIVAVTQFGHDNKPHAAYAGLRTHRGLQNLEQILAFEPDLVITNHSEAAAQLDRLRARGVPVFDLGELRGVSTLLPNIDAIAALIGKPEAGRRYAEQLRRRLERLASDVPPSRRRRGIYLGVYGTSLFGGTRGTSYHDVLTYAGLTDAAAGQYRDWPQYTAEQVLALDPDVVMVGEGSAEKLCRHAGLDRLRVCADRSGIVELSESLAGDPGPRLLDAAEALHDAVYR